MERHTSYHLEAYGGSPAVHSATFYTTSQNTIILTNTPNPQHTKSLLNLGPQSGIITSTSTDLYYTLSGPSGKGDYRLSLSQQTKSRPGFIGSSTFSTGWEAKDRGNGRLFLRNRDETFDSGFWIAVPSGDGEEGVWEAWWYSPSAANLEDFKEYVMFDIELVREDGSD